MTPEEMNCAIAQACGVSPGQHDWIVTTEERWATCFECGNSMCLTSTPEDEAATDALLCIPNYCGSLDVMHTAERVLTEDGCQLYHEELGDCFNRYITERPDCPAGGMWFHVSAKWKAEAFLRTLELWKD